MKKRGTYDAILTDLQGMIAHLGTIDRTVFDIQRTVNDIQKRMAVNLPGPAVLVEDMASGAIKPQFRRILQEIREEQLRAETDQG